MLWLSGEVLSGWEKGKKNPIFKKGKQRPSKLQASQITSVPGNTMENILLGAILKCMQDKEKILGMDSPSADRA